MLGQGIERAALVVDALLGTGVHGLLREPVRSAVELCQPGARGRRPGARGGHARPPCDLTSGELSDPVVRADVTVTFHRPKTGLLTAGAAVAGRVLVAPIGIPAEADRA